MDAQIKKKRTISRNRIKINTIYATPHRIAQHPVLLKHGWEKVHNCLFVHREKGIFLSVYVDDIRLAGRKQNIDPMWKVLHKEVDLGEPTSFLDLVCISGVHSKTM